MRSHLLQMLLYATLVAVFFAALFRRERREQVRLGAALWAAMVGGGLLLAFVMYPFPR